MSERIKQAWLDAAMLRVNAVLGRPTAAYTKRDGRLWANVGNLHLDNAAYYGGWCINEMCNDGGGVTTPFGDTRVSAAEMGKRVALKAMTTQATQTTEGGGM